MITLLLVRHGHTVWHDTGGVAGRSDIDLSEHGQQAIKRLARNAAENFPVDSWHTSPLLRTRHTSQLLRDGLPHAHNLPHIVDDERLVELDFGDWEGMTWQSVHEQYRDAMKVWGQDWINRSPPNGETFAQQHARCAGWLADLSDKVTGSHTALVVLHGGSIRALLCHCLGWPLTQAMSFSVDPASVTRLDMNVHNGKWLVRAINAPAF